MPEEIDVPESADPQAGDETAIAIIAAMVEPAAFVGRTQELERLAQALQEARAGRGSVVALVGEPGIGKTRLADEVGRRASAEGWSVHWGRSNEAAGAPAYWPWRQMLRRCIEDLDAKTLKSLAGSRGPELVRLLPELRERVAGLPEPAAPEQDARAQFLLFEAVTGFLGAVAEQRPLLLVLDDLHWADRPSLLLLQHVAREVGRSALLVIATYRNVEVGRGHPLAGVLAELHREPAFERIQLDRLSEAEVGEFLRARLDREPEAALVRTVAERTGGNPFFLREVAAAVAEGRPTLQEGVREALGPPRPPLRGGERVADAGGRAGTGLHVRGAAGPRRPRRGGAARLRRGGADARHPRRGRRAGRLSLRARADAGDGARRADDRAPGPHPQPDRRAAGAGAWR